MTDEEREDLCRRLRKKGFDMDAEEQAADEIERLALNQKEDEFGPPLTEREQLVNILRHAKPMYVGSNIRRQAADEIERLAEENDRLNKELDKWVESFRD